MRSRLIKLILPVILSLCVFNSTACQFSSTGTNTMPENSEKMLSPEEAKEDLNTVKKLLLDVHPSTIEGLDKKNEKLINDTINSVKKPISTESLFFKVQNILNTAGDAHTSINYSPMAGERSLKVYYMWLADGLYIGEDNLPLKKGDKVLEIGNKSTASIFNELSKTISHENDNWVRAVGEMALTMEYFIDHLGIIDRNDNIKYMVLRDGKKQSFSIPFKNLSGPCRAPILEGKSSRFTYSLLKDDSIGIFTLNTCVNDDAYKSALKNFFASVRDENIKNVVVDLRRNTGGDSSVTDEFLNYLPVKEYKGYGAVVRVSEEANAQNHSNVLVVKDNKYNKYIINSFLVPVKGPEDKSLTFKGNVFVLISKYTCSAANWFGAIIQDNKLGTLVGEPSGNAPNCYGNILSFTLPNSKINLSMSYKYFERPDKSKKSNALEPDILVKTTIDDILNNRDPQLEKIKSHNSSKCL